MLYLLVFFFILSQGVSKNTFYWLDEGLNGHKWLFSFFLSKFVFLADLTRFHMGVKQTSLFSIWLRSYSCRKISSFWIKVLCREVCFSGKGKLQSPFSKYHMCSTSWVVFFNLQSEPAVCVWGTWLWVLCSWVWKLVWCHRTMLWFFGEGVNSLHSHFPLGFMFHWKFWFIFIRGLIKMPLITNTNAELKMCRW